MQQLILGNTFAHEKIELEGKEKARQIKLKAGELPPNSSDFFMACSFDLKSKTATIENFGIDPAMQGKGRGRERFLAFVGLCRHMGMEKVELTALSEGTRAWALYGCVPKSGKERKRLQQLFETKLEAVQHTMPADAVARTRKAFVSKDPAAFWKVASDKCAIINPHGEVAELGRHLFEGVAWAATFDVNDTLQLAQAAGH